jgi:hypothetical protein
MGITQASTNSTTSASPTSAQPNSSQSDAQAITDSNNTQWKLLFGGEIVGFTWTKDALSRSVILQCEDWSNYWDYALQAENTDIFGPGLKAVFSGASTNLFTDFLQSKGEVLTQIVCSGKCNTFPLLKGLAAGIIRLIEAVGGSYYAFPTGNSNTPPKRFAGQNIFFSYNELRLHITQMVGTPSQDPTSEKIMRYQGYSGMFSRALGSQGGEVSIRQAMNAISQIIFYEMFPQPCPNYVPGTYGEVSGVQSVKLSQHPDFSKFATAATDVATGIGTMLGQVGTTSPSSTPSTPGAYQSSISTVSTNLVQQIGDARRTLLRAVAQMSNVPQPAPSLMATAAQLLGQAATAAQGLNGGTGQGTSSASALTNIQQLLTQAQTALQNVANSTAYVGGGTNRSPAQLLQQIFRPDVWFAAPPRCNVFFPELYNNLSYARMFLKEPTRLMLKTNDEFWGEDMLFDHFYFAPEAGTVSGDKANMTAMLKRQLLLHERFTGILPVFEKMGEFNIFASHAEHRVGVNKIGLAQRTTNFLYFRHRFNARRMTVSGKFNPYVAVGCPGLIIDKYVSKEAAATYNAAIAQQNISQNAAARVLGTNFLGNFTQVVHQASTIGPVGNTDIQITFARQPEEKIDFLGTLAGTSSPTSNTNTSNTNSDPSANAAPPGARQQVPGGNASRSTNIAAIQAPALTSIGPSKGTITNVVDVTNTYVGQSLPYFDTSLAANTTFQPPSVPIGTNIQTNNLGSTDLMNALGGPGVSVYFHAYTITESIARYTNTPALLPAEEYIRPGWYGDIWTNDQIGQVWNELFGTGSITDPQTISDQPNANPDAASNNNPSTTQPDPTSVGDPTSDTPGTFSLQTGCSIEQAVQYLLLTYSYIKQQGIDVDAFIGSYVWRPIATLVDIFGTSDLAYDASGQNVVQGYEGFHSRAIGPYNNLFGLVNADIQTVLNITPGSTAAQNVDIRGERRTMVEQYVAALLNGSALLG